MRDEYTAVTRFADLDTQRHVTSRTYEEFALEGRYRLLNKLGHSHDKIQNEQIYLNPVMGYVKFHRQQFPGAELKVVTEASPSPPNLPSLSTPWRGRGGAEGGGVGEVHWDQKIFQQDGELVCHLQQLTQPVKADQPLHIAEITGESKEEVLYEHLKPWSGAGERIVGSYQLPYSDRDFAGKYNLASLWKIFEEGRWIFVEKVGLTYQRIVELDTTSFFMGSVCNFFAEIPAGRTLQVMTWIERIEKIRYWFRQDVLHNGKLLASMRDEQLIVSLSRARPQRATPEFIKYIGKYIEYPTGAT